MKSKKTGRPPLEGEAMKAHSIHLTTDNLATASDIGDGNVSIGVRFALNFMAKRLAKNKSRKAEKKT